MNQRQKRSSSQRYRTINRKELLQYHNDQIPEHIVQLRDQVRQRIRENDIITQRRQRFLSTSSVQIVSKAAQDLKKQLTQVDIQSQSNSLTLRKSESLIQQIYQNQKKLLQNNQIISEKSRFLQKLFEEKVKTIKDQLRPKPMQQSESQRSIKSLPRDNPIKKNYHLFKPLFVSSKTNTLKAIKEVFKVNK